MARILVVTQHFRTGGLETQIESFCRHLSAQGDEIHIATDRGGKLDSIEKYLAGICRVDCWAPEGESILAAAAILESYLSRIRADWIHLHPFETFFSGSLAALRLGIPYCVSLHSPSSLTWYAGQSYRAFLVSCLLPDAARVFAVSRETACFTRSLAPDVLPHLLPNPIDLTLYRPVKRDADGPWALVSRLDREKIRGLQEVLALFAKRNHLGPAVRVAVFGDGDARPLMEDWAQRLPGAEEWLEFRGHTGQLYKELRQGWAGLLGMGRVVLESVAMDLPILLVGYDGVKGRVTRENIDRFAICNFSGRREKNIGFDSFQRILKESCVKGNSPGLREWLKRRANAPQIWQRYRREMADRKGSNALWTTAFEDCCHRLGKGSIYSADGAVSMFDSVIPSTGRPFTLSNSLLIEFLKMVDERRKVDAELADHVQATNREKGWSAERISSLQNELTVVRQEREQALRREAAQGQRFLDERERLEGKIRVLQATLSSLKGERDHAVQSGAMVLQILADEKGQWLKREADLEEELFCLRQEREEALRREAAQGQRFLDEREGLKERIRNLETTLRSLEEEWYDLIDSEAIVRQALANEKNQWLRRAADLEQELQSSRQDQAKERLTFQQEKISLEGQILKLQDEQEALLLTDRARQQEFIELKEKHLQLVKAIEEARQGWPWKAMQSFRRVQQQFIRGDARDRLAFIRWGIRKTLRKSPDRNTRDFDPLPEDATLFLSLPPSQEQEVLTDPLKALRQAVELAQQTLSWRIMRLARRFREWVLLGHSKSRWQFLKWVWRKLRRRNEDPGSPSFDPIGNEISYDLGRLQRAIENARKIRSWKAMCFLRAFQINLAHGRWKGLWQLRRALGELLLKENHEEDKWVSFDPIPQALMQSPPPGEAPSPGSDWTPEGRTICILALDRGWGDILMSLPVAEALKKKDLTCKVIYLLEQEGHATLLRNNPFVDDVIFSRDSIALYPDAKVFDIRQTPSDWHRARIHLTDMIAIHFGVEVRSRRPSLYLPDDQVTREKFRLFDRYVVAHLQSTTKEKDWDLKHWPIIFEHLFRRHGRKTVLVGGPNEDSLPEIPYVIDLRGKTSLSETINIMKWGDLFIGIDSGPMHLAGALNVPSVVLWGNTSPILCGIHSDLVYNLEPERKCLKGIHWPCHFSPCAEQELCIDGISVQDVLRRLDDCLSPKRGGLLVHIGETPWTVPTGFSAMAYCFIPYRAFSSRALNEIIYSSASEKVAVLSSIHPDPDWGELERLIKLAGENGFGITSIRCFRHIRTESYAEYKDNTITKCHRGSDAFMLFQKAVFARVGGGDSEFDTLVGYLNDFYFRALLLNETVWYVQSNLPVSSMEESSRDRERLRGKWAGVDIGTLQHLDSVSFIRRRDMRETLFLIFSHCSLHFNGGGQRWDSLHQIGMKHGLRLFYIDEIMPDERTEAIFNEFLAAPSVKKIVIWARPVPRYQRYFHQLSELGIPQFYDCIDDWGHIVLGDSTVPSFEETLFKKSTMVTVTAEALRKKVQAVRPWQTNIPLIPNGADPEVFNYRNNGEAPTDLKRAPVTLGYFGSLAEWWIDDRLLCDLAGRLDGQGAINLIGPCKQEYRDLFSKYENIAVLGQKRHDELPHYLSKFDVALIPFRVIPVTESTSPVKAYEYLFGGKPIVSTDLPEVRHLPYTFCSKTNDDFLSNALKASQVQIDPTRLDEFRVLNSWESRFRELLVQIEATNPSRIAADIIIVSYNTKDITEACIRSIERHTKEYQLFIVDNNSTDGSVEMLEEYERQGRLRLIKNRKNEGYGKAVNAAFKKGSSAFVVILNSDIEVLSNWLEPLIERLSSDGSAAAVAPKLIGPDGVIDCAGVWGTNAKPLIRFSEKNDYSKFNRVLENVYLSGACMVTRRSTFAELGQFDEQFFFYFEDMDFGFQARYHGYKLLYIPESVIVHHRAKASTSNQEQAQQWYLQNQQRFLKKWKDYLTDAVEYPHE